MSNKPIRVVYVNKVAKTDITALIPNGETQSFTVKFFNKDTYPIDVQVKIPKELIKVITISKEHQDFGVRGLTAAPGQKSIVVSVNTALLKGLTKVEVPFIIAPYSAHGSISFVLPPIPKRDRSPPTQASTTGSAKGGKK